VFHIPREGDAERKCLDNTCLLYVMLNQTATALNTCS